jgi:hypothetical protein
MYSEVIAPNCRGCHAAFDDGATFNTPDNFRGRGASSLQRACGNGPRGMPTAEQTTASFLSSSARAIMVEWLDAPGACVPN